MGGVDTTSLLVIVAVAALSAVLVMAVSPKIAIPVVVVELVLGIVIGPQGLDLAQLDATTELFGNLGLGMLFFFAGYEIDFERIRGKPLRLGIMGWILSLALAYAIGGALAAAGIVLALLYTGSAMATTAIGTLIPILKDVGEIKTRFGTYLLAAGGMGEFGPILLVTLILSTTHPLHEAAILAAFIVAAVLTGLLAVRSTWRSWPAIERTLETSSQAAVRLAVVLVFGLVALASELGLGDDHPHRAAGPRGERLGVEADRGRLRPLDPLLLHHQRHGLRPRRTHGLVRGGPEDGDVRGPLPCGPRRPGAAALQGDDRKHARPAGARLLLGDPAAARGGDNHARG
jgi:hypothetical protein